MGMDIYLLLYSTRNTLKPTWTEKYMKMSMMLDDNDDEYNNVLARIGIVIYVRTDVRPTEQTYKLVYSKKILQDS